MRDADPKGPGTGVPESTGWLPPKARCTARSRTSGEQCKQVAIPGGTVCYYHGGAAPQVRKKAALRLIELVDPAITVLAREMVDQNNPPAVRLRAVENILDRGGVPRRTTVDSDLSRQLLLERLLAIRNTRSDDDDEDDD